MKPGDYLPCSPEHFLEDSLLTELRGSVRDKLETNLEVYCFTQEISGEIITSTANIKTLNKEIGNTESQIVKRNTYTLLPCT